VSGLQNLERTWLQGKTVSNCLMHQEKTQASQNALSGCLDGAKGLGKGDEVIIRATRQGDKAAKITRKDGSVIDISPSRVKEFTPNIHPKAPAGSLQRTKFSNYLPGSKGFKRAPTQQELDLLKDLTK